MSKIWGRVRRHKSAIVMGIISIALYVCLFALFFGTMGINNWQLRHASRTLATTLLTYCVTPRDQTPVSCITDRFFTI